jgi:hypothetical protein
MDNTGLPTGGKSDTITNTLLVLAILLLKMHDSHHTWRIIWSYLDEALKNIKNTP